MSLVGSTVGGFLKGGIGGAVAGFGGSILGSVFGDGDENIARSLSKQVGCQIPQQNAAQARALLQKGLDPCDRPRVPGITDPNFSFNQPQPQPIPVWDTPPQVVTGPGGVPMVVNGTTGALEYTRTGLIRNVIVNGRRVSRRKAASFIRRSGMEIGARGLGITLQQAAQVVLQQSAAPRRRRGISGAQIAQARRVINTLNSFSKNLSCGTRRAPARRKTSCR